VADITMKDRARAYILAHPDESKTVQAAGANCSLSTVATVRRELQEEGKLVPHRKTPAGTASDGDPSLLDHKAMVALAEMEEFADLDDDEIQKRMLRQTVRFAFDPKLSADTRMAAHTAWQKLKDNAKAKDLGPGPPMTRPLALARLTDLTTAVDDVTMVVEALFASYPAADVISAISEKLDAREQRNEGQVAAQPTEAPSGPAGATPAP